MCFIMFVFTNWESSYSLCHKFKITSFSKYLANKSPLKKIKKWFIIVSANKLGSVSKFYFIWFAFFFLLPVYQYTIYQRKRKFLFLFYCHFYENNASNCTRAKIVQYNTCYLTSRSIVTPDTIEFSGFQILRNRELHMHTFIYKIILLHSISQQTCFVCLFLSPC